MGCWYVYVIHEVPLVQPYKVKVGFTRDPLRRLKALQAGNPRYLRAWDYERLPTQPFGVPLKTREQALIVEARVHEQLRDLGHGFCGDFNFESNTSYRREWYELIHPNQVWNMVIKEATPYIT